MVILTVDSVVIFSHRYLYLKRSPYKCQNFCILGCLLVHLNKTSHNTDIKESKKRKNEFQETLWSYSSTNNSMDSQICLMACTCTRLLIRVWEYTIWVGEITKQKQRCKEIIRGDNPPISSIINNCSLSQNMFYWSQHSRQESNNIWCDFLETCLAQPEEEEDHELH